MLRYVLLALCSVLTLACGTLIPRDSTTPQADDNVNCRPERSVGSNFSRQVCRTPAEESRNREEAQTLMTPSKVPPRPTGAAP